MPDFESIEDRAGYYVERMARAYLDTIGADDGAKVLEYRGELVSLTDLIGIVGDPLAQMMAADIKVSE